MLVAAIVMTGAGFITFYVARKSSNRMAKHIPAVASSVGLLFFTIKLNFIPYNNHAFEGIYDVLAIIFLGFAFVVSIIIGIFLDLAARKRDSFQN